MGARKLSQSGQAAAGQGAMAQQPNAGGFGRRTEQQMQRQMDADMYQAYDRASQAYNQASQTRTDMARQGEQERARFMQDRESQARRDMVHTRSDMARQGDQDRASFMVAPQYRSDQERTATRAQPSTSSYQQMHMKMLQDRAGSGQGPMVRQDTANDQRMNDYMARQTVGRRFSWQR
jgi:hypothetical protein